MMPFLNTNLISGATLKPYMNINLFSGANPKPCHIPHIVSYMNTNLIFGATGATSKHLSYTPEHKLDFWSNYEATPEQIRSHTGAFVIYTGTTRKHFIYPTPEHLQYTTHGVIYGHKLDFRSNSGATLEQI